MFSKSSNVEKSKDTEGMEPVSLHVSHAIEGEVQDEKAFAQDAVFGEIGGDGPNYRNVCIRCSRMK